MRTPVGAVIKLQVFLSLVLDGGDLSASSFGRFASVPNGYEAGMGRRVGPEITKREFILAGIRNPIYESRAGHFIE